MLSISDIFLTYFGFYQKPDFRKLMLTFFPFRNMLLGMPKKGDETNRARQI